MKTLCRSSILAVMVALALAWSAARPVPAGFVQEFSGGAVLLNNGDTLHGPVRLYRELEMVSLSGAGQAIRAFSAAQVKIFAVHGGQQVDSDPRDFSPAPQEHWTTPPYAQMYISGRPAYRRPAQPLEPWYTEPSHSGKQRSHLPPNQHFLSDTGAVRTFRTFLWDHDRADVLRPTPAFFEQLSNGPYLLLRRQRLEPGRVIGTLAGQGAYYAPSVLTDRYYLADPKGRVQRLPKPKRNLLAVFQPHAVALATYATKHHLNFDDPAHLAELVTYGNSLVPQ